jgi:Carboxylesterase family/Secretion system C-terminal sorting domain
MKKKLQIFTFMGGLAMAGNLSAQRYLTEIFDDSQIQTTFGVVYATNIDFLTSDFADPAIYGPELLELTTAANNGTAYPPQYTSTTDTSTAINLKEIRMNIYQPDQLIDNEESRPVIIFLHTGNFLPPIINGGITGSMIDSAGVNLCKQWAKRGFVAISADYRLGWNPISEDENIRRGTLLNAVYRSIQDTKMAVRFLKSNADSYNINPDQICLYGQGSGGYVVNAYVTLDNFLEYNLPKFIDTQTNFSYIQSSVVGAIDGYGGSLNLYRDNFVSSDIAFSANAGGALADSSWIDGGEPPHVSIHCVRDPFAPFDRGIVIVPTTNEDVVEVDGSNVMIDIYNQFGNNDIFASIPDGNDVYTDRARSLYGETIPYIYPDPNDEITINEGNEGLFPVVLPISSLGVFANASDPWNWWDFNTLQAVVAATNIFTGGNYSADTLNNNGLAGNPLMSQEYGLTYIDTIQGYLIPRIVLALDLVTSIEEINGEKIEVSVYPNPSANEVTVSIANKIIEAIELRDINGKLIINENVGKTAYKLNRELPKGLYNITLKLKEGNLVKKLVIE